MLDYTIIKDLFRQCKLNHFKRMWKKKHADIDGTIPMNIFPASAVSVGKCTYGELNIVDFNNNSHLSIGCYCSLAQNVTFLLDVEHNVDTISSYPFKAKVLRTGDEATSKGDIIVDDDVWIGYRATILSGVHIGQGAVVAAGAVVTKDVPPYAIVGGVPAKVIKYRFEPEMIEELLKVDYNKLTKEMVQEHIEDLYVKLTDKSQIDWMPKNES